MQQQITLPVDSQSAPLAIKLKLFHASHDCAQCISFYPQGDDWLDVGCTCEHGIDLQSVDGECPHFADGWNEPDAPLDAIVHECCILRRTLLQARRDDDYYDVPF